MKWTWEMATKRGLIMNTWKRFRRRLTYLNSTTEQLNTPSTCLARNTINKLLSSSKEPENLMIFKLDTEMLKTSFLKFSINWQTWKVTKSHPPYSFLWVWNLPTRWSTKLRPISCIEGRGIEFATNLINSSNDLKAFVDLICYLTKINSFTIPTLHLEDLDDLVLSYFC